MKIISTILLFITFGTAIEAATVQDIYRMYRNGEYKNACRTGLRIFNQNKKNSRFLMLYGLSCLKADYIDRLAVPMTGLRNTKTERANASYFATILLQKKLLYHALVDHVDISHLRLPTTDYILSKIFDMYTKGNYRKVDGRYIFEPANGKGLYYVLYVEYGRGAPKMIIEERVNDHIIKTHRYW
ncbi:hypothetical protein [Hydrogenimonas sp. SS33]|uniref:hypothetical protein n=1 Tax=Hydrogenimonas leucolamina TaxID=2954236 RepID=UPI00336BD1A6